MLGFAAVGEVANAQVPDTLRHLTHNVLTVNYSLNGNKVELRFFNPATNKPDQPFLLGRVG
jgi:hypothetical protein